MKSTKLIAAAVLGMMTFGGAINVSATEIGETNSPDSDLDITFTDAGLEDGEIQLVSVPKEFKFESKLKLSSYKLSDNFSEEVVINSTSNEINWSLGVHVAATSDTTDINLVDTEAWDVTFDTVSIGGETGNPGFATGSHQGSETIGIDAVAVAFEKDGLTEDDSVGATIVYTLSIVED